MTVKQFLAQSGINFHQADCGRLGRLIMTKAREKKVRWGKKEEVTTVNDYPEEFLQEMEQIAIDYFKKRTEK